MKGDPKLYYPAQVTFYPDCSEAVLRRNLNTGSVASTNSEEARLFQLLQGARTIEQHVGSIAGAAPEAVERFGADRLFDLLSSWQGSGLLRPLSGGSLREPTTAQPLQLSTVSADRPQSLARWLAAADQFGGGTDSTPILVLDDSRSENTVDEYQQIIDSSGVARLIHVTRADRAKWCETLGERLRLDSGDAGGLSFHLLGPSSTAGETLFNAAAARNTLFLLTRGRAVLSVDDDVLPQWRTAAAPQRGVVVGPAPRIGQRFASMVELREQTNVADSPLGALSSMLGAVDLRSDAFDLSVIPAHLTRISERQSLRVVAATLGYHGARPYIEPLRGVDRQYELGGLVPDGAEALHATHRSGIGLLQSELATIEGKDAFATAIWAFDGTETLAPFMPWGRREDDSFALLTSRVWLHHLLGELPVTCYHDPTDKPPFRVDQLGTYELDTGIYNYATLLLFTKELRFSDPISRLAEVARRYVEIGTISVSAFREFLWSIQTQHLFRKREELLQEIDEQPEEWGSFGEARIAALKAYVDSIERSIGEPDMVVPAEWRSVAPVGDREAIESMLKELQGYYATWGRFLPLWPEVLGAAEEVNLQALR